MPKSRIILALGFFIALLPELGFPHSWNSFFEVASGLLIVLLSVLISVDRRLMLKAKAEKRAYRKRAVSKHVVEERKEAPVEARYEPLPVMPLPSIEVSMPEAMPLEAVSETPVITDISHVHEPVTEAVHQPKRRRKVRVLDGDAAAPLEQTTFNQDIQ